MVELPLKSMWPKPLCLPVSLSVASLTENVEDQTVSERCDTDVAILR